MVSLCLPHVVDVSAFRMFRVFCALRVTASICLLNVYLGSYVKPSIFGCKEVGSVVLFSWRVDV